MFFSTILFYCILIVDFEGIRFYLNPYGPYVPNKIINGKGLNIFVEFGQLKVVTFRH